jgi:PAS domain S-box-containing protein
MDMKAFEVLKSLNLLYVEDDVATREELAMMLEPWVGELHVAADGQEGLELFKVFRPDIVVTDIQMPRASGLAMSGEIRRLAPKQPIVVLSAYNDVEYLFRAIELGIDQYITKPVSVERLLDKLAQMTNGILAVRERQRNQVLLEQYKHLVDHSAIVCKLDLTGRITYVNNKLCEISGYVPAELIGREIANLWHESEPIDFCQDIFAQVKSGTKWAGMIKKRRCTGEMYVVDSTLVPILDEHGTVTEIVSLDVDGTSYYRTFQNLVETLGHNKRSLNEQRHFLGEYKRALEVGSCICITNRQRLILSVNKQFEKLLGYTSEALEGKPISEITNDASVERCLEEAQQANQETLTSRVVRFVGRDGEELNFSVACLGVHDLAGEVESIIMICQDLTEFLSLSQDIVATQRELLYMLGDVVENRSHETGQHVRRVAQVSKFLALKAGVDPVTADMIETAAPMHDVGKVGIRDVILHKPGKLDVDEFEEMKAHARIGYSILCKVDRPLIGLAAAIAHEHHESYDGKGYPHGLKGEEISMAARIVCIADVLDALYSPRSYKSAWEEKRVFDYFREQRGKQFDPRLVDLLLANWDAIKLLRNNGIAPDQATGDLL